MAKPEQGDGWFDKTARTLNPDVVTLGEFYDELASLDEAIAVAEKSPGIKGKKPRNLIELWKAQKRTLF